MCRTTERSLRDETGTRGPAGPDSSKSFTHRPLHRDANAGHRLIQHDQLRVERERAGDATRCRMALAAGELVRRTVAVSPGETDSTAVVTPVLRILGAFSRATWD